MIYHLALLLICQLVGEVTSRSFALPIPGPVLGMTLLLILLLIRPAVAKATTPTATGLLSHLSLLFVPAGVGVVGHFDKLGENGLAILATLVISTVIALAVGALTFVKLVRT
ncbi:CidA/LrgA family protein [Nereida sp. MMG025]|uniref:CidA/LrgA family protein n=1 Tax=Nereida sp. MMG025 TaxID=2909981 RepID=UPI001F2BAA91|nr:CidA/LrgA family protein [Nereida sp. MMG025]MCF6444899.1 CidA/LrgA family protein [Nereida sp. MMG025]